MNKILHCFYVPYPDVASAKAIGNYLVENKLAACIQYHPVTSHFIWNKQLEETDEIILIAKTIKSANKALRKAIRKMHPYEVPCIAHWEVKVNKEYYNWVKATINFD